MTSELKVDKITPASGTNTQIGESGDTTNLSAGTVTLPTSIITGQTEKTSLVDADKFLISDSAASGAFKYVQKSNLGGLSNWSENSGNLLPSDASYGIYLGVNSATASNLLDDYETGTFGTAWSVTGATYRRYQDTGDHNSFEVSCILELTSVTDYISAFIYQNQGSSKTLEANHTNFSAYRLIT